jgi:hypothetical protein
MKRPMIPEIDGCKVLYNNNKKKLSHARDHPRHLYFCPSFQLWLISWQILRSIIFAMLGKVPSNNKFWNSKNYTSVMEQFDFW